MAKLRSAEEFLECLDAESAWRKREISNLDKALSSASGPWESSLVRMGIVMLSAHWEGFVKVAATRYLEYVEEQVSRRSVTFDNLAPHFRALSLWKTYSSSDDTELLSFVATMAGYFSTLKASPDFLSSGLISTKSNLTGKRFRRLIHIIGLANKDLETRATVIERNIVARRHEIAHGGRFGDLEYSQSVKPDEYASLVAELLEGLDGVVSLLHDAAINKVHLANQAAATTVLVQP